MTVVVISPVDTVVIKLVIVDTAIVGCIPVDTDVIVIIGTVVDKDGVEAMNSVREVVLSELVVVLGVV